MISMLSLITWKQWREHRLRTLLTVVGIALGVAVFFAVRTANVTLINSLTTTIEKVAGKATLQVVGGESGFPEALWDVVKETPGVKIAEPAIEVMAHTAFEDEGNLMIVGVDMLGDKELREYQFDEANSEIGDPLVALAQPDSILIARNFADKHQLKEGDKLPLYTVQGKKEFTVRGIFKPAGLGEVFGGQVAMMDVFNAQFVFGRGKNFDRIDLMNEPEVSVEELQQRLRSRLPAGVEVERPTARGQGLENTVKGMNIGMTVTSLIALLVGMFIIFNTFSISVNQRWKEIGVLRAVGVERRNVQRMFLGEAAVMGMIGSALGILLGFGLAVGVEFVMSQIASQLFALVSTRQAPVFRPDFALLSFMLGVGASIVAAWMPSRAASQLNPAMALHNIESRQREAVLGKPRLAAGIGMVALGLGLIRFSPLRADLYLQFGYAILLIFGMVAVLPKLSEWSARAMRPLMDRLFGSEGVLAVDSMIQAPRRTSATVGALMIGLMFVFATGAYVESQKQTFDRWMRQSINADLVVTTTEGARSRTWHFSKALSEKIAALPGVSGVTYARMPVLSRSRQTSSVTLVGVPMDLGTHLRGVDMGPSAIRIAGLNSKLAALGVNVRDLGNLAVPHAHAAFKNDPPRSKSVLKKLPFAPPIVQVCKQLMHAVDAALKRGDTPLVLGGDHGLRVFARRRECGGVDAHRIGLAGLGSMQVMMYATPAYFAAPGDMAPDMVQLLIGAKADVNVRLGTASLVTLVEQKQRSNEKAEVYDLIFNHLSAAGARD